MTDMDRPTKLPIKVSPSSTREGIAGWFGNVLKVRVTAPAERGKANAAAESVIAKALGVPRKSARIVAGKTAKRKVIEISGLTEAELHRRLDHYRER